MTCLALRFAHAPYRLSGQVFAALLNDPRQLQALGDAVHLPPYKAPPRAPVMAVMPRNTLARDGDPLVLPAGADALEVGASLGLVIGRVACGVTEATARDFIAGYVVVGEVNLPLESHYRPATRLKARDGFCPVGPAVVPADAVADPDTLASRLWVDGVIAHEDRAAPRVRGVAALLAAVTEFMTLQPGDILALGRPHGAPPVRAGQSIRLEIDGLGALHHRVVAGDEPA